MKWAMSFRISKVRVQSFGQLDFGRTLPRGSTQGLIERLCSQIGVVLSFEIWGMLASEEDIDDELLP